MEKQKNSEKMGRRYDRDFKRDAVGLVQSGKTVTEVARSLGVSPWSLTRWHMMNGGRQVPRTAAQPTRTVTDVLWH